MFKGNIVDINFNIIKKTINEVSEPKILLMNESTVLIFLEYADKNPDIKIKETEYEELCYFCDVPISINPTLKFGEIIVK